MTEEAKGALGKAIAAVEAVSSAEVVIAVRRRSRRYVHANFITGIVGGFAALATMLYVDHGFSLSSILLDPFIAGAIVGLLSTALAPLERWMTPASVKQRAVKTAAQSTFYEKRVRHTSGRTGLLVYVSLLERRCHVVPDSGILEAVAGGPWERACAGLDEALARGQDGVALARAIERLGDVLGPALPVSADDLNELPDEVCA